VVTSVSGLHDNDLKQQVTIKQKELAAAESTGSSRHVDNSRRLMPSASANATMLSHFVSRATAICRKAFGNFPTRFLATCHPLRVPRVPIRRVSI
jgi:hypothetical protein